MKRLLLALIPFTLSLACGSETGISTRGFFIPPVPAGSNVAAAYVIITNPSGRTVKLIGAQSDVAESVEIHAMEARPDGTMAMRPLSYVEIAPHESIELAPGGHHLMLIGLKRDLTRGETVMIELQFESDLNVRIPFPVQDEP